MNSATKKSHMFLSLLSAVFLALQSMLAAQGSSAIDIRPLPPAVLSAISAHAWQNLQDTMASLNGNPGLGCQGLLDVQAKIFNCQSALFQANVKANAEVSEMDVAAKMDFLNADLLNPVVSPLLLVDLGDFENTLLHARTGSVDAGAFIDANNFYKNERSLIENVAENFMALEPELSNIDPSNPAAVAQLNQDMGTYDQNIEKLQKKAHHHSRLALRDAVSILRLTADEQQMWNQFQSTLAEKCKAASDRYRVNPTFAAFPYVESDIQSVNSTNPAAKLQVKFEELEAVDATISAFALLKQACLYEFLNVLLTKRNDHDSSLNSFHQLQGRLDQFLSNVDVNNAIALLQAQVDMLAYEKEVSAVTAAK